MGKTVTLRKSGNSKVLTAPTNLDASLGTKYEVEELPDGVIVYRPIERQNIFSTNDWQDYDYQKDFWNDAELGPENLVGKERLE